MIKPFLKDEAFLADVRKNVSRDGDFHLWWLGQSGFLLHYLGFFVLIDPYLSDSLSKKYEDSDKPHVRMTERVIDPTKLDFISIVTSSHNHTDHLDGETLIPLLAKNQQIQLIIPEANRELVSKRTHCKAEFPIGLKQGETTTIDPFTFHAIPAAHNELDKNEKGECKYLGYVIQFGPWTVYHSGDTLWYDGMEAWLLPFSIDLAILPINGNKPERRVAGNLDGREAAKLGRAIGARMVIPCHYDMFTFNTADPAEFAYCCEKMGQSYSLQRPGQIWSNKSLP